MYVAKAIENPNTSTQSITKASPHVVSSELKAGAYLYYEGDEVERLFQIETGVVRLTRVLEDGRRQVIAFGYPGDIIGFPAGGFHHTDCDALVQTRLRPIKRTTLEDGRDDPALHAVLLQAALNEISAMQDHFMMLGRKTAAERVASFISVLLERYGKSLDGPRAIDLPMSRADIADFLGLTTETVSRCFTALRKAEIIALDGAHIVVELAPNALEKRANGRLD